MGLGEFTEEDNKQEKSSSKDGSSTNGSSSSGGSSNEHPFPKYEKRYPYAVVRENGEGELEFAQADLPAMEFRKDWYSAPWQPADHLPADWKRVWWEKDEFDFDAHAVSEVMDSDLWELMRDNARRALEVLKKARGEYVSESDPKEAQKKRTCVVCDEVLDIRKDEYEWVNDERNVVCAGHTAEELIKADLL